MSNGRQNRIFEAQTAPFPFQNDKKSCQKISPVSVQNRQSPGPVFSRTFSTFQIGSQVSYNEVGQLIGLDPKAVERYVDILGLTI